MKIERATDEDLPVILKIQKLAFETMEHHYGASISALTQTLEKIQEEYRSKYFLKAVVDNQVVGAIRARLEAHTCLIGKFCVHPKYQNHGIGTQLLTELEAKFSTVKRFRVCTGHLEDETIRFYQKLGYIQYKTEKKSDRLTFVCFEKGS